MTPYGTLHLFVSVFTGLLFLTTNASASVDKSGVKPTVLSLPSGPGSIEGLGESFEPQLNSGTATYNVKLKVPPGRAGFSPELVLSYNAGNGTGSFGLGWRLELPYLQRRTDKGLPYYTDWPNGDGVDNDHDGQIDEADEFDVFVYSGGEELVPTDGGFFRLKNEREFIRFVRNGTGWTATRKDGVVLIFGTTAAGRIEDGTGKIFKWLLEEMKDLNGNTIRFFHDKLDSSSQRYFTKAEYNPSSTGGMSIVFEYEARPDVIMDYRPLYELKTAFRCKAVWMLEGGQSIRSYLLSYEPTSDTQPHSLLSGVTQLGRDGVSTLPPAQFTYVQFDGTNAAPASMPSAPKLSFNNSNIDLIDLNGDGLADILDTNDTLHAFYRNLGQDLSGEVMWGPRTYMTAMPKLLYLGADSIQLADMDGDGRTDLLDLLGMDVNYYSVHDNAQGIEWASRGLIADAGFNFQDANTKLVDLNNDGLIDVLRTTSTVYYAWLNLKDGKWSQPFISSSPNSNVMLDRAYIKLADMNGDRLQDLVWIQDNSCRYYPNIGFGKFGPAVQMQNAPYGIIDQNRLRMIDVNGDGLSDAAYIGNGVVRVWLNLGLDPLDHTKGRFAPSFTVPSPYSNSYTTFRECDANGNGSKDILWNTNPGGGDDTFAYLDFSPNEKPYQLKTITNGIGRAVTIFYRSSVEDMVRDRDAGRPWPLGVPFPVSVVSRMEVDDGLNTYSTDFRYHDGYYDGVEKEFRGFASADRVETGSEAQRAPTLVTAYEYDTGATVEALKGKPLKVEARTESGEVFFREKDDWTTRVIASGANGDARNVTFPYQFAKTKDILENGMGNPVQLTWAYEYDDYGNMIRQIENGRSDPGWDDERITETTYTAAYPSGISLWILDKVVETKTTDENGVLAAHKRDYYDGFFTLGQISKGNLTKVEDWVSGTKFVASERKDYDQYGNVIAAYDSLYGKTPGHYREFIYDNTFHTFPVQEIIHTGKTNPSTLSISATYDFGFGAMKTSTDFNGNTTSYDYDTFGRLFSITKPPDIGHTVEYEYVLAHDLGNGKIINWVETRQKDGSEDGFLHSRTFYDGLSRKVMTRVEGEESGQVVVTDTVEFNARKTPWKKYLPYFETGTLDFNDPQFNTGFTEHFYDATGREVRINQPVGPEGIVYSTMTYEPLSNTVRDEEQTNLASPHFGGGKRYVEDGLQDDKGAGRLREVYEIVKLSDTGEPLGSPVEWKTAYRYDLLGDLTGYTDSQGNQKSIQFDGLGRKTYSNDPDRGTMTYTYDDAGNLIKTVDAKGQVIRNEYDGANRLRAEYYGATSSVPDIEYHYDTAYGPLVLQESTEVRTIADAVVKSSAYNSVFDLNQDTKVDVSDVVEAASDAQKNRIDTAKNTLGFLSWVKDQAGEEHNSFDSRGRVEWVLRRIIGSGQTDLRNFTTAMEYDSMDRVTKLSYPDSTYVSYSYNSRGFLESVPNVISRYDYNSAGQNALLELASGVVTTYVYDHRLRLSRLQTVRNRDNLKLQDLTYTYDGVSNITGITDGRNNNVLDLIGGEIGIDSATARKFNSTQSFAYDSLYRLVSATNSVVYGNITYRYDRIGNMIDKSASLLEPDPIMDLGNMTIGGAAGAWNRVGRAPGAAPGPHAITATAKGPNGPIAFGYDDNGNMSQRGDIGLGWNYEDRIIYLTHGTKTAQYSYDYSGSRKKKTVNDSSDSSTNEVLYVDKFSEVRHGKLIKYIYDKGSQRIAMSDAVATGSALLQPSSLYLHDHLGTANLTLAGDATVREQLANYPYGEPRKEFHVPLQPSATDYKFTGKERDTESDLSYFETRYYDAAIGRFVSVDPLLENSLKIGDDRLNELSFGRVYAFVSNNPISRLDATGLDDIPVVHPRTPAQQAKWNRDADELIRRVVGKASAPRPTPSPSPSPTPAPFPKADGTLKIVATELGKLGATAVVGKKIPGQLAGAVVEAGSQCIGGKCPSNPGKGTTTDQARDAGADLINSVTPLGVPMGQIIKTAASDEGFSAAKYFKARSEGKVYGLPENQKALDDAFNAGGSGNVAPSPSPSPSPRPKGD